ncbi:hypothetical protein [Burkholderia ubonensis]|uniref:hypothetical protein n=1 Tax=Burkholderia ubonensis TaxID=101571 RepID=UPI0012FC0688|nr:hypothetical protein [Burkholderia ubonensis]
MSEKLVREGNTRRHLSSMNESDVGKRDGPPVRVGVENWHGTRAAARNAPTRPPWVPPLEETHYVYIKFINGLIFMGYFLVVIGYLPSRVWMFAWLWLILDEVY